jgi:hypothetical protein
MDEQPQMKKRSSIRTYLIAFPMAWLVGGVFAVLVLHAVDNSLQLGPGTEFLILIASWLFATLALTVGIAVKLQNDSSRPQTPTGRVAQPQSNLGSTETDTSTHQVSKAWSVVAVVSWLLVGAAVVYGWMAISFWSNQ